jgi:hypothetical protein
MSEDRICETTRVGAHACRCNVHCPWTSTVLGSHNLELPVGMGTAKFWMKIGVDRALAGMNVQANCRLAHKSRYDTSTIIIVQFRRLLKLQGSFLLGSIPVALNKYM